MRPVRPASAPRLRLEPLEDRAVPAGAFQAANLVSDQSGVAPITDPNLVNSWGIAVTPTGGEFWISDNGPGLSSVYTGDVNGSPVVKNSLVVNIPFGAPTGQVFNGTNDFVVAAGGASGPALFITASETGWVDGWSPGVPPPVPSTAAQAPFVAADGAVYKGIALGSTGGANFLYLADFHGGKIDVLDKAYHLTHLAGSFTDPNLPAGFAPFNVAVINGQLYVSYAKQDATRQNDVGGAGNGFIDVFDLDGTNPRRLVSGGPLNSPWGMVVAPASFGGGFAGALLVGNFKNGQINAFDPNSGAFLGTLTDATGQPLVEPGLWGLTFGNGTTAGDANTLYFSAGPARETHGLFGKIIPAAAVPPPPPPPPPPAGRDGPGLGRVVASGRPDGSAQVFAADGAGQLHPQGGPVAPFTGFTGEVRAVEADVNGDGTADTILVTGPGAPVRFAVLNGADGSVLVPPTDPFGGNFTGGAFVAAGDVTGTGRAEWVITPDQGGGPRVVVFALANGAATVQANFFGIDDVNFRGGARAALGDVNGDGTEDLVVGAGFGGGPRVAVFDGRTLTGSPAHLVNDFFAFPGSDAANLRNGVFVAAGDFSGAGHADLAFGGGPGGGPRVLVISGAMVAAGQVAQAQAAPIANFFAFDSTNRGGVRVAAKGVTGGATRDLVVGTGPGLPPALTLFPGRSLSGGTPSGSSVSPFPDPAEPDGVFVG